MGGNQESSGTSSEENEEHATANYIKYKDLSVWCHSSSGDSVGQLQS